MKGQLKAWSFGKWGFIVFPLSNTLAAQATTHEPLWAKFTTFIALNLANLGDIKSPHRLTTITGGQEQMLNCTLMGSAERLWHYCNIKNSQFAPKALEVLRCLSGYILVTHWRYSLRDALHFGLSIFPH
jgi:hypothetical protein